MLFFKNLFFEITSVIRHNHFELKNFQFSKTFTVITRHKKLFDSQMLVFFEEKKYCHNFIFIIRHKCLNLNIYIRVFESKCSIVSIYELMFVSY